MRKTKEEMTPEEIRAELRSDRKILASIQSRIAELSDVHAVRIIDKYFKLVDGKLVNYSVPVLKTDFGKDFETSIAKYEGYINNPTYLGYVRDHITKDGTFWNTHEPLTHDLTPGEWALTEELLRHLFGSQYEMALDWIQIVLTNPKQLLPIPCLVSDEQNTGKSSFLRLLQILFRNNTAEINIEDLTAAFNSHWATKHIICIDETETDGYTGRDKLAACIKSYVTANGINVNEKSIPVYRVDFYSKFVICSNREKTFLKIQSADTRYWVIKVPRLSKYDPKFFLKLNVEAPAFLEYLRTRVMETKTAKSRLWFSQDQIKTNAFSDAAEQSKSWLYFELLESLKEWFEDRPSTATFRFSSTDLREMLVDCRKAWDQKFLLTVMKEEFKKIEQRSRIDGNIKRGYDFTRAEVLQQVAQVQKESPKEPANLLEMFNLS